MKKFTLGFVALAFLSMPAFAQSFLKCDFKIADNDVDCPFLGRCPQKVLRESKTSLSFELVDGQVVDGSLAFQKVVLHRDCSLVTTCRTIRRLNAPPLEHRQK